MSGVIYIIKSSKSRKFYVGSAQNKHIRKGSHFKLLRENKHHSPHLQRAFNKHGEKTFSFKVVEVVDDLLFLRAREQFWISRHQGQLYNISKCAFSPIGVKRSKKVKDQCKKRMTGNTYRRGKKMSKSFSENQSKRLIGNQHRKGVSHSENIKKKISEGLKRAYAEGRHSKPDAKMCIRNLGDKCKKKRTCS